MRNVSCCRIKSNFQLNDWLSDNIAIIAGAAVGIAVVEMIGVLFSCYILKNGDNEYNSRYA